MTSVSPSLTGKGLRIALVWSRFNEELVRGLLDYFETTYDPKEVKAVLDPTTYVGRAPEIVDEVLQQQRAAGWLN